MAANDWTDWHLTPEGWVRGTSKTADAYTEVPEPENSVARCSFHEYDSFINEKRSSGLCDIVLIRSREEYNALILEHGLCPRKL